MKGNIDQWYPWLVIFNIRNPQKTKAEFTLFRKKRKKKKRKERIDRYKRKEKTIQICE